MTSPHLAPDPTDDVLHLQPRLRGLAYRMLGDVDDAEEVVQEAYLRWHRVHQAARDDVRSPEAWLVTVVSRLALDRLRRAATERAAYVGPWLPSPVPTPSLPPADAAAELASDLSVALLLLLERLAPEERAAFLLREVFGTPYEEIARILERSEPAVRQVVSRARRRVQADRARFTAPAAVQEEVVHRFIEALRVEDAEGVLAVLAPDVSFTGDGGGKAKAARRRVEGIDRVSRFYLSVARKARELGATREYRPVTLNGMPGWLTFFNGRLYSATTAHIEDGRIRAFYIVLNPDKLRAVREAALPLE
jgi:RNA polymerase sigma-70 factor (ECF subfamily)